MSVIDRALQSLTDSEREERGRWLERSNAEEVRRMALNALKANEQCIADFIELYKRGTSNLVFDEAVKSLRDDALKLTQSAILALANAEQKENE